MSENDTRPDAAPKELHLAVKLLWGSLAIGPIKIVIDYLWISQLAPALFTNLVMLLTLIFIAFLNIKIASRKNWARLTFLVLFLLGTVPTLPLVMNEFGRIPIVGMLSVLQIGAQLYALVLLFRRPAALCFKKA